MLVLIASFTVYMTNLGEFFKKKSVNKAEVSRKTGISASRLSELSLNNSTKLRADEVYLIALAIDISPNEILEDICKHLTIKS